MQEEGKGKTNTKLIETGKPKKKKTKKKSKKKTFLLPSGVLQSQSTQPETNLMQEAGKGTANGSIETGKPKKKKTKKKSKKKTLLVPFGVLQNKACSKHALGNFKYFILKLTPCREKRRMRC